MKIKLKCLMIIIVIIISIIFLQKNVEAKSYEIDNMDIQATINQDGSVNVKQTLKYKFNGEYNGIYITIPTSTNNEELTESTNKNIIPNSKYNASDVIINNVTDSLDTTYRISSNAVNGDYGKYTISFDSNLYTLKVYSPSKNTTKTFVIDYTLENLCVKHNDVGELYYNFIGGEWQCNINNVNIDVMLPNNTQEIKIWGHGPYNGISKIVSSTFANFKVSNVKAGQYVATRILFNNEENIPNCTKMSGVDAKDVVLAQEKEIHENRSEKESFTIKIVIMAICILIYWIILLLIFEKDKKYILNDIDDDELFKRYNPMVAGCIQGSRDILARDIIAVILSLINKNNIKLIINSDINDGYIYRISKNPELENEMDEIETYIYKWVFGEKNEVVLNDRLKEMAKEKGANKKFKELNKEVEQRLANIGSNQAKVPLILRGFNVFLFALSIFMIVKHIMFNKLNIFSFGLNSTLAIYLLLYMIPIFIGIITIFLNIIIIIRHKINKTVQKISGQRVVTTTVSLVVLFTIIMILTAIFAPDKYLVADEFLLCVATILVLTDNLMMKNSVSMIEDYSKLNSLKYKIANYSLLKERNIEQVTLWENYLAYAVAFGIARKITKEIKEIYLDDDLSNLISDGEFSGYIDSDYDTFYEYASLDRRFLNSYNDATSKAAEIFLTSGGGFDGSDGGRRWFLWRWRFLWRWPEAAGGGGAF